MKDIYLAMYVYIYEGTFAMRAHAKRAVARGV